MFEALEGRRAEIERHAENAARLAQVFQKFETTGQGSIEFEDRVDFGLTFIEEPYMNYGAQIDVEALGDLLGLEPEVPPSLPISSGMVTAWDQDDRDFYTGAWVAVTVFFPDAAVPVDTAVYMNHHFTFTAIAMKDVPVDLRD
jgi:hypothetical protein